MEDKWILQNRDFLEELNPETYMRCHWEHLDGSGNISKVSATVKVAHALDGSVVKEFLKMDQEFKARDALPEEEKLKHDLEVYFKQSHENTEIIFNNWGLLCDIISQTEDKFLKDRGLEMLKSLHSEPPFETPWSEYGRELKKENPFLRKKKLV